MNQLKLFTQEKPAAPDPVIIEYQGNDFHQVIERARAICGDRVALIAIPTRLKSLFGNRSRKERGAP